MRHVFALLFCFLLGLTPAKGQVLISLLLGDKLNTEKIEFGITGGFNRSQFLGGEGSDAFNKFNLGFYFHIRMLPKSFLSTGVFVKNTMGGTGMPTYAVGNPGVDTLYTDGVRSTNMNSFYVPVMWQQRLAERWLLEGGIQTGLIYETEDEFDVTTTDGGKLAYTRDATDDFVRMDVGLVAGLGFKFTKQPKSVSAGALYYHGLVDMDRSDARTITNSSFYFYIRIPIGVGFDEKADN